MKYTTPFLLAALLGAGCTSSAPEPAKAAKAPTETRRERTDPRHLVADQLRQATESAHFAEALNALNPHLEAARLEVSSQQRAALAKELRLTDDELAEVEAATFRPSDAYYLQECCLLRDAAQVLEIRGLSVPEQARLCQRWVTRNVVLHQQGDEWLPPLFTLKRGHGDARARAIVLLALMRQFQAGKANQLQPIEGVVLALPAPDPAPILVGILDPSDEQLYLFDPRRGEALLKNGRIATLKDLQQRPEVAQAAGISSGQVKELQALLTCPLAAVSPRMKELDDILERRDRIKLYLDPLALQTRMAAALPLPVQVWNAAATAGKTTNSPLRTLRLFLPPEEGGVDRSKRLDLFKLRSLPRMDMVRALDQLLLTRDLAPPATRFLNDKLIATLLVRYYLQPHEYLLHGQYEAMLGRFDRVRPFLEDEIVASPQEVAGWREKANQVYARVLSSKDPRIKELEVAFWNEDQYIGALLAENDEAAEKFKKNDKGTLTRILAFTCREPVQQRVSWLEACCKQEMAERSQAAADVAASKAAGKANKAWLNARGAWNVYVSRVALSPTALRQRLGGVQAALRGNDGDRALAVLEAIHLDLHRAYSAKLFLHDVTQRLEGPKPGEAYARNVARELDELIDKDDAGLKDALAQIRKTIDTVALPQLRAHFQLRAELLGRDWNEQGPFFWLRQRFQRPSA